MFPIPTDGRRPARSQATNPLSPRSLPPVRTVAGSPRTFRCRDETPQDPDDQRARIDDHRLAERPHGVRPGLLQDDGVQDVLRDVDEDARDNAAQTTALIRLTLLSLGFLGRRYRPGVGLGASGRREPRGWLEEKWGARCVAHPRNERPGEATSFRSRPSRSPSERHSRPRRFPSPRGWRSPSFRPRT